MKFSFKFITETRQSHRNLSQVSTKSQWHTIHSCYDQYAFLKNFAPQLQPLLFANREYNVDVERKRMKIGFIEKKLNVIYKKLLMVLDMEAKTFDSQGSGRLRMDTLCNLQSLPYIEAENWIDNGGLANMTSLQQLGIDGLSREQVYFSHFHNGKTASHSIFASAAYRRRNVSNTHSTFLL
ncbi:hypothetical protein V6N13_044072 [Hibiscus sabdariffa]|uniref:Uncharacterized protein n=1 Tax=Hibiscus sabdariffa TaxID=183260 RepID=A0ABR2RH23_9ROSI